MRSRRRRSTRSCARRRSEQDGAVFLTAALTGLRLGELLALAWGDVDFAGQAVRVRRSYTAHGGLSSPKSGRVRSVPMVPDVARALAALATREWFTADDDLVFPGQTGGAPGRRRPADPLQGRASSEPACGRCASTTCATPSGRSPSAVPRCRRSRRGWATRASRRRCGTSITATAAMKHGCSPKRSASSSPRPRPHAPRRDTWPLCIGGAADSSWITHASIASSRNRQ